MHERERGINKKYKQRKERRTIEKQSDKEITYSVVRCFVKIKIVITLPDSQKT